MNALKMKKLVNRKRKRRFCRIPRFVLIIAMEIKDKHGIELNQMKIERNYFLIEYRSTEKQRQVSTYIKKRTLQKRGITIDVDESGFFQLKEGDFEIFAFS